MRSGNGALEVEPIEAALRYARRGWPVFPCHQRLEASGCSCGDDRCSSPAKHPRTRRGLLDASIHRSVIERWWSMWPQANVAIRTGAGRRGGGLLVLDVDPDHGGEASLHQLASQHGPLPTTRSVLTGGGGMHLYFAHPGGTIRNSAGALGPGLDVRGDGGYVIAPPSAHTSGMAYRWAPVRTLAPPPGWLVEVLATPERQRPPAPDPDRVRDDPGVSAWAAAAVAGELDRLAKAEEGRRNHVLNRAAFVLGQIVGGGHLDGDTVSSLLEEAGVATGLGSREATATVESGMRAGRRAPRHPRDRSALPSRDKGAVPASGAWDQEAPPGGSGADLRSADLPCARRLLPDPAARQKALEVDAGVWP